MDSDADPPLAALGTAGHDRPAPSTFSFAASQFARTRRTATDAISIAHVGLPEACASDVDDAIVVVASHAVSENDARPLLAFLPAEPDGPRGSVVPASLFETDAGRSAIAGLLRHIPGRFEISRIALLPYVADVVFEAGVRPLLAPVGELVAKTGLDRFFWLVVRDALDIQPVPLGGIVRELDVFLQTFEPGDAPAFFGAASSDALAAIITAHKDLLQAARPARPMPILGSLRQRTLETAREHHIAIWGPESATDFGPAAIGAAPIPPMIRRASGSARITERPALTVVSTDVSDAQLLAEVLARAALTCRIGVNAASGAGVTPRLPTPAPWPASALEGRQPSLHWSEQWSALSCGNRFSYRFLEELAKQMVASGSFCETLNAALMPMIAAS